MLRSMNDGEISISAYDTAWVALVQDIKGSGRPQFPASLEWIANNQLPDGSWGDHSLFLAHDRIINTLACLIALKSWNVHPGKQHKGMAFIREKLSKIGEENGVHMPIGFEVAFPSLIEKARSLGVEVAADKSPVLEKIYAQRSIKLARIPRDIMHSIPTTLLHSLEGMEGLDWGKLIKLQSADGSFLFSPASTAYALMQTKDHKCLNYLEKVVQRFKGGDRGICWARNSGVQDIDDTAMGFRLLRLHGYQVSASKKDGGFICFVGQSTQAVTGMYNLYRASQVQFLGENILEEARGFSSAFLREKQASYQLFDKWIISKNLAGEVQYALDIPWYANLPRVETRFYIEQYGGEDDVWIGKTLYRMPYVSNNTYLELAKLDYNSCQALHLLEWDGMLRWYGEHRLEEIGLSQRSLLQAYFIAAASIFEPEKTKERIAWAKTTALTESISSCFGEDSSSEHRRAFTQEFERFFASHVLMSHGSRSRDCSRKSQRGSVGLLLAAINELCLEGAGHDKEILHQLYEAWRKWLMMWEEGDRYRWEAGLIVRTIQLCATARDWKTAETWMSSHPQHHRLFNICNRICHQLAHLQRFKKLGNGVSRKRASKRNSLVWKFIDSMTCVSADCSALPVDLLMLALFEVVFSMLDEQSLYYVAATHIMFRKCATDPLCRAYIDLRTGVPKVNNAIVSTMSMIQRVGEALRWGPRGHPHTPKRGMNGAII
ncbi:Gly-Xaa carboxypeptidase [Ancistrocladus abbreviatus]